MMMSINKNLYRVLVIISFLLVNGIIIFGISSAIAYMNTGADRSKILNIATPQQLSNSIKINWETANCIGRTIEKQTILNIEKDYLQAWQLKHNALRDNNLYGIKNYYTDSAYQNIKRTILSNKKKKVEVQSAALTHNIDVKFYSADGHIVILEDKNIELASHYINNGNTIATTQNICDYRAMLLFEDGYWRIRHLKLEKINKRDELPTLTNDSVLLKQIAEIKGLNYYPQSAPWKMFGEEFDPKIIAEDFALLKTMGLNTVRIFVQYEEFGKENVDQEKIKKLKKTLTLADNNELKVIVTLFDFYGNYDVKDIAPTLKHAHSIINSIKEEPALFAWDIKNEPDLDFETRGRANVILWLNEMIRNMQIWDTNHPITIGWSNTESAELLASHLHFVSFHDYLDPQTFNERVAKLSNSINNKAIMLQEYGYSSYSGIWNAFSSSQQKQREYYNLMQKQIDKLNLGFVFWTLYDFNHIPNSVVGYKPWHKSKQSSFGIIDKNGNRKEAFPLFDGQ
ncbi:glycoside hydrolase 5 family protein [Saccharicrinis aurantiacus]|uniref:glycosyl hydrolase family 5 n=1 Tax=Saccharicrinis aurantiacus TaxID=1849719 RepID=UPI0011150769|nr:glycosyl hydrolase family 5 [Saccharicrinis aurantiacus]